jgi:hypothetical protein
MKVQRKNIISHMLKPDITKKTTFCLVIDIMHQPANLSKNIQFRIGKT